MNSNDNKKETPQSEKHFAALPSLLAIGLLLLAALWIFASTEVAFGVIASVILINMIAISNKLTIIIHKIREAEGKIKQ